MKTPIAMPIIVILVLSGCKQKSDTIANADTDTTNSALNTEKMKLTNEEFLGSWELQQWTAELEDGTTVFPFGDDALGRISYDADGNMAVQVMKNNRGQFLSEDPLQAKPEEVVEAFNGFIAYSGTYHVDPGSNQVVHQIRISSFPNWVGQDQVRFYDFSSDTLTLSTGVIGSSRHQLIWKRVIN